MGPIQRAANGCSLPSAEGQRPKEGAIAGNRCGHGHCTCMLCPKCAPSHPRAGYSPATRKSWLHGLGAADEPGKVFFRKDFENSEPAWIPRLTLNFEDHINTYPMIDEPAGLAWFDQVAALEVQAPNEALEWTATRQPGPVGPRSGRRCRLP